MGSITFAAVAKCLIPLNFPSSIVASQLNPWLLHTMSSPIPRASAACGAPGSTAGLHLPCCPVPSRAQTAFDFLKWECLESPRQEGCTGALPGEGAGRGLCSMEEARGIYRSSSGVTVLPPPRGGPKAHPHPDGGLVWGTGEVWRLLIPRAKDVLLWRSFSFQQSMEMCLSGNCV